MQYQTNVMPFWAKRNIEQAFGEATEATNKAKDVENSTTDALVELADLQGKDEVDINDLTNAVIELAQIVGSLK